MEVVKGSHGGGIRVTCMRYMGISTPLTSHDEMKGKKKVRETKIFIRSIDLYCNVSFGKFYFLLLIHFSNLPPVSLI